MSRINRENLKVRILRLTDLESTGTPADLASTLDISERSVKRLVGEIRGQGHKIRFCHCKNTYIREREYY